MPVVEVHLSNVEEREEWRRQSVIADVVAHRVVGKGPDGYREALAYLAEATGHDRAPRRAAARPRRAAARHEPDVNIDYLTGFDSSNAALLVEHGKQAKLFTDFRYIARRRAGAGREGRAREPLADDGSGRAARAAACAFEADVADVLAGAGARLERARARADDGRRRRPARGQGRRRDREDPPRRPGGRPRVRRADRRDVGRPHRARAGLAAAHAHARPRRRPPELRHGDPLGRERRASRTATPATSSSSRRRSSSPTGARGSTATAPTARGRSRPGRCPPSCAAPTTSASRRSSPRSRASARA